MEKKAVKYGSFNKSTITASNTIAIFAMLILQDILEELAANPVANLPNIISIADSIANFNSSIIIDP